MIITAGTLTPPLCPGVTPLTRRWRESAVTSACAVSLNTITTDFHVHRTSAIAQIEIFPQTLSLQIDFYEHNSILWTLFEHIQYSGYLFYFKNFEIKLIRFKCKKILQLNLCIHL